ncbi:hypothetical protein Pfo_031429 [Paulownia fortunei]|nr:hypothetical protein Pfo_031429 [Paulownia fortunei]
MNCLIWNIRGVGNEGSHKHLHSIYQLNRIKLLVLLEPMVQLDGNFFCRRFGFSKSFANTSNKIWFFVDNDFEFQILRDHEQLLHIEISSKLIASPILVTSVYAKCSTSDRKELWDELRKIADELDSKPWLVGGDFNVILDPHEKKGSSILNTTAMNDFGDMITNCGLIDAGFEGQCFTWTNKRVWERLDRILYSDAWLHTFQSTKVTHLLRTWSDHAPLLTTVSFSSVKPPSSFRFMRMWMRHHLFLDATKQSWISPTGASDIFNKIKQAQKEVAKAETTFDDTPTEATQTELNRCTAVLTHALTLEEDFWRQKAACRWVDQGEINTKFFHSLVKKKRARGTIHSITHNGILLTAREDIAISAAEFFQYILSDDIDALLDDSLDYLERLPAIFCPESLCSALNMEEIRHAVFDMDPDSATGPVEDVRDAVEDFFSGTPKPRSFTATTLVLIPKTDSPDTWNDFRPISLCNVTNKIITKLLSLRLAKRLPDLIAPSQSGFVQGRLISDNILLAQELIHSIDSRHPMGFLIQSSSEDGFPASWISYVRHCIENCWFTVLINGVPTGDPISPLLFVLAADFLSRGLDALFRSHEDMYYRNQALRLTHLSYADNIIIFSNCEKACLIRLMEFLTLYSKVSGQRININKSSFVVSKKCPSPLIQRVHHITGFLHTALPITYLGAPLYKGNKKCALYQDLIGKMRKRLQGWEKTTLSHGGRLALIKSTLSTMPLYLIQVLHPPKMVIHTIEQIMARFFGGSTGAQKRMHWTSWNTICSPVEEGGLGIRKIEHVVKAFSLKLWWRFMTTTSLWASYMLQKYCCGLFPGKVKLSVHDSPIWKRLCGTLGDGEVSFWHDHWIGEGPLTILRGEERHGHERVNFYWADRNWNVQRLLRVLPRHLVDLSCGVSISCDRRDTAVWKLTTHGDFSIPSAWESMRQGRVKSMLLKDLWGPYLTPTMSIPADLRLQRKGLQLASKCQCCSSLKSIQHIFISGDCAREVWENFANTFHIRLPFTEHPAILIQSWKLSTPFSNTTHIRTIIPLLIIWFLWTKRNDSKHRNTGFYPSRVIWKVHNHLYLLFKCRKLTSTLWRGDLGITARLGYHFIIGKTKKTIQVHWAKPQSGWFKLNTDGASRGTEGTTGAGGIIRDHLGDHILAFQDFIRPASSIFSELYTLNRGLQLALIRGITHLWIEIDALVVIHILRSSTLGHWRLQQLLVDIKNVLHHMTTSITHIYREGNRVVDFLANVACDTTSSRTFTAHELLGHILGFIRLDQLGTPSFRHL